MISVVPFFLSVFFPHFDLALFLFTNVKHRTCRNGDLRKLVRQLVNWCSEPSQTTEDYNQGCLRKPQCHNTKDIKKKKNKKKEEEKNPPKNTSLVILTFLLLVYRIFVHLYITCLLAIIMNNYLDLCYIPFFSAALLFVQTFFFFFTCL